MRQSLIELVYYSQEQPMQAISKGYNGLSVLMDLNWDLALYLCTIVFALCAGAFVGSLQ